MPIWTATLPVKGLMTGVPVAVFDAEVPTDGQESQAVALPFRKGKSLNLTLAVKFASAPTTVDYQLQVAMNNVDAEYQDLGTAITATGGGQITVADVVARFARVQAVDADVEAVTAELMVN